jgi:hypothetical protein
MTGRRPPRPLADAAAERTLLGCCMRDPTLLDDRHLTRPLFAVYPAAFTALTTARGLGTLAGDLATATTALAAVWSAADTARAYLDAEDVLSVPLRKHVTGLAHRRQAAQYATALQDVAESPSNPLDDRETFDTLAAGVAQLGRNGTAPHCRVATVEAQKIKWLWHRRLALGKVSIIDGDPGLGKTALTIDLAARLTSNRPFPDDGDEAPWPPHGVVFVNAEDGIADTIRPRLDAAGANCNLINAFPLDRIPVFPQGISQLRDAIVEIDAMLVIIDPIMAVLAASIDAYRDQDVRLVLNPLGALAEACNVSIVCVRHLTKSPGPKALYRGSGSIAFSGVPRTTFVVGADPENPDDRIFVTTKNNLSPHAAPLRFALEPADTSVRVLWKCTAQTTADELVAPPAKAAEAPAAVQNAMTVLSDILANGPIAADTARKEKARLGISEYAWRRAYQRLGVTIDREEFTGGWTYFPKSRQ